MEEKLNGIVLNGINYGENDQILSIFTLEKGVISAYIKGVKKAGAKLKFAKEPFCFCEFIILNKGEKKNVINASLLDGFYPIRESIEKFYCGCTVLEYVKNFLKTEIISKEVFMLSLNALKELAYSDKNPKQITAEFIFSALKFSGYGLNTEGCFSCHKEIDIRPFFDYSFGAFFCSFCATSFHKEINFETYKALQKIGKNQDLTETESVFALRLLDYYVHNKTEVNLKSLKELLRL